MKRLLHLTALALGLTLLLSACGHKNTEPERKDAATQTVPVEGITGLTLCDGDVTLRFEKDEEGSWIWHDDPAFPLEQSAMDELLARLRVTQRRLALVKADTPQESPIFTNGALKIVYGAGCAYLDGA